MAFTRSFMIRVLAAALGLLSVYAALQAQSTDALFDDTGALQEIRFRMNTRDWQALKDNFELDTYYPADLSWRGLDNVSYYRLVDDNRRHTVNDTGTGNTLNMSHPRTVQMVMDSLRYFAESVSLKTGISGFESDGPRQHV